MSKKIIFGGVGLVVVAAVAVVAVIYKPWARNSAQKSEAAESRKVAKLAYVDVKEMTLRLSDTSAEHYIRFNPVLAVAPAQQETVAERIPVVRDRIVGIVTAQSSTSLSTPDGERELKKQLIGALRKDFGDDLLDIYFSGYLVE
jgi:flagellar basal body-associated protein FliL